MTRCPDPGALRAALDDERPDVAEHVAGCAACTSRAADLAATARIAAAALATPALPVDVDAGLTTAQARATPTVVELAPHRDRRMPRLGRAAAAVIAVLVVGVVLATPGGRTATASLLERFRAERVAVVPVDFDTVDVAALEALADAANIDGPEDLADPERVRDLASAAEIAGFSATPLERDLLPATVDGPVRILAQRPQTVRFTFGDGADVPEALHDAVLVVDVPGAIVQIVGNDDVPAVIRGEAGALQMTVEGGLTLAQLRDVLLAQPGLPPETVAALRDIEDWETTVPLPVPSDYITWEETTVDGHPALAFGDESGVVSALLWNDGTRFVGIGGQLPLSEVRRLAETP